MRGKNLAFAWHEPLISVSQANLHPVYATFPSFLLFFLFSPSSPSLFSRVLQECTIFKGIFFYYLHHITSAPPPPPFPAVRIIIFFLPSFLLCLFCSFVFLCFVLAFSFFSSPFAFSNAFLLCIWKTDIGVNILDVNITLSFRSSVFSLFSVVIENCLFGMRILNSRMWPLQSSSLFFLFLFWIASLLSFFPSLLLSTSFFLSSPSSSSPSSFFFSLK